MGVSEAIEAEKMVKVDKVMGVHYDTFPFIKTDHGMAVEAFKKAGIALYLPEIGQNVVI